MSDSKRITRLEAELAEAQERVNEYAVAEQAADAARIALYNEMSIQLCPLYPGLLVSVAASATAADRERRRTFSASIDAANEKMRRAVAASAALAGATTRAAPDVSAVTTPDVAQRGTKRVALSVPANMPENQGSRITTRFVEQYTIATPN